MSSAAALEAHALDQRGRTLAEGERLLGQEVEGVEAGDLVLDHVRGEREQHAEHALASPRARPSGGHLWPRS